jgi:hypothetical protein
MIDVMVFILEVKTGYYKTTDAEVNEREDGTPNLYIWEEGNYSCDCNRGIFFGEDYDDVKCGDGKYLVKIKVLTGEVIYDEWPDPCEMLLKAIFKREA